MRIRLLAAGAVALAGTFVPVTTAHANCPDGWCGAWGQIVASPYLTVRSGPHLTAAVRGSANHNDTVEIHCWAYGDYVNQGVWKSAIWDSIVDQNTGVAGYAADSWIQTTADVRSIAPAC